MKPTLLQLLQTPALHEEFERLCGTLRAEHVAVTAASGGEGVTSIATLLACSLAASGPVLLVEGNLRQPTLARELALHGPGLLEWDGSGPLPVHTLSGWPQLAILTAGGGATSPAPGAARLSAVARRVRADFARSVWDTPAATRHPDLQALTGLCDGALVVAEMDRSRVDHLLFLRETLQRAKLPILGSVLNRSGRYWPRSKLRAAPAAAAVR